MRKFFKFTSIALFLILLWLFFFLYFYPRDGLIGVQPAKGECIGVLVTSSWIQDTFPIRTIHVRNDFVDLEYIVQRDHVGVYCIGRQLTN